MKILVTGFEPFGEEKVNPASAVLAYLPSQFKQAEIITLKVPTSFHEAAQLIYNKMLAVRPDVVVALGQAGGRSQISLERVAINIDDARIPDNNGNQPIDEVIQADGPAAYFSTLPIKAIVSAIQAAGIPATVSNTAGTYVCNHIMYQLLYFNEQDFPNTIGGFLHVPYMLEQVVYKSNQPAMSLDDIARAVNICLETTIAYYGKADEKISAGKIH